MSNVSDHDLIQKPDTKGGDELVRGLGLRRRGNSWEYRRGVPLRLREIVGHREIVKSFGDISYADAKRDAAIWRVNTDAQFLDAERKLRNRTFLGDLSDAEIKAIARRYFAVLEEEVFDPISETERLRRKEENARELYEILSSGGPEDPAIQAIARGAANLAGVTTEGAGKKFFLLSEAVHSACLEHHRRQADRLGGKQEVIYNPAFDDAKVNEVLKVANQGPKLAELIDLWEKDGDRAPKSISKMKSVVNDFKQVVGDLGAMQIGPDQIQAYKVHLMQTNLSPKTKADKLNMMQALFSAAKNNRLISENPCSGIRVAIPKNVPKPRVPFSVADLTKFFSGPVHTKNVRPEAGRGEAAYWLPILSLYTGGRLNELGQLHVSDIEEEAYVGEDDTEQSTTVIWFRSDGGEGKRMKNAFSRRRIPMHRDLIKLGFMQFVNEARRKGQIRLFHDLPMPKQGSVTHTYTKWFGRYLRFKCEILDKRLTFHSFRHFFKDNCRRCGIPMEDHYALTGHKPADEGAGYGNDDYPIDGLVRAIERYRVLGFVLPPRPPSLSDDS
ncbi:site-specific integrase [Sphingobium fluviale]|uniref:Uncharacterized protein n=1 Tax=Sphingobium fluviale TaxID=2506423 RepID=A0A4Q1KGV1_9SPHN|nr:site-specific integrase [Sphingobium fluviale]RXR28460.1 hypothetical protein EQG66_10500 [Sphingobium fluviale]